MRKLCYVLTALLLTAPALAGVTISCAQVGETNEVTLSYLASDDANLPRGFGLNITVDNGQTIDEIASGTESDDYWVYPGTIDIVDGTINSVGTPVAPSSDPCTLGGLGTSGITLEMGSLYDPCDPEHPTGPGTSGTLLNFKLSVAGGEDCNVTIVGNSARGNVVLEDTSAADVTYGTCYVLVPACYTGPDYDEWVSVGKPDTWCYLKQCHGDATGSDEQFGRGNWVSVGLADFQVLLQGYNDNSYVDPATDPWIAADFTHSDEQFGRGNWVRVGLADFQVLLAYYNDNTSTVPADCLTSDPCEP